MPKRSSPLSQSTTSNSGSRPSKKRKYENGSDSVSPPKPNMRSHSGGQTQDFVESQVPEHNKENITIHRSQSETPKRSRSKGSVSNIIKNINTGNNSISTRTTPSRRKRTPSRQKSQSQSQSSSSLNTANSLNSALLHIPPCPPIQNATIIINGVTEKIDMSLLRNIGYFHRKLARPSMEIVPVQKDKKSKSALKSNVKSNLKSHASKLGEREKSDSAKRKGSVSDLDDDDDEIYRFEFDVTTFTMRHFKMLIKYCNESEQRNDDVDKPKIATKNFLDLEQFVYAADYFLVYDIAPVDIEKYVYSLGIY